MRLSWLLDTSLFFFTVAGLNVSGTVFGLFALVTSLSFVQD